MDEIDEKELFGSDIKIEQKMEGKFDFAIDRNGDFVEVIGSDYMIQRVINRVITRRRFIPPQLPELINNNEILKENITEDGRHFFPGDLELLGYPDYGSLLGYMLNYPDTPHLRILITDEIANTISSEGNNGIERIDNIIITKPNRQSYNIEFTIGLVNNKTIEFEQNIGIEV